MPLQIHVELGGSGTGITYHLANVACPRRRQLDDESPAQSSLAEGADERGTAFHGLLAYYYKTGDRGFDTRDTRFVHKGKPWVVPKEALDKARRMFQHYRTVFPPTEFGRRVDIEKVYKIQSSVELDWKPQGVTLTAQIDLGANLAVKQAKGLAGRGVLVPPGYLVVDHKTVGGFHPILPSKYQLDIQNKTYQLVVGYAKKIQPVGGLINLVTAEERPKFWSFFVPPPTENDRKVIRNLLQLSQVHLDDRAHGLLAEANPTSCLDFNKVCHHFTEGRCKRY